MAAFVSWQGYSSFAIAQLSSSLYRGTNHGITERLRNYLNHITGSIQHNITNHKKKRKMKVNLTSRPALIADAKQEAGGGPEPCKHGRRRWVTTCPACRALTATTTSLRRGHTRHLSRPSPSGGAGAAGTLTTRPTGSRRTWAVPSS